MPFSWGGPARSWLNWCFTGRGNQQEELKASVHKAFTVRGMSLSTRGRVSPSKPPTGRLIRRDRRVVLRLHRHGAQQKGSTGGKLATAHLCAPKPISPALQIIRRIRGTSAVTWAYLWAHLSYGEKKAPGRQSSSSDVDQAETGEDRLRDPEGLPIW